MKEDGRTSRIFRLIVILQSGRRYTSDDLADMLGVSRRTLFRDLKDLKRVGIPCRYNKKTRLYETDPSFFLPSPALTDEEALSLLLLAFKAGNHINMPFKDSLLQAALKIESNLPPKIRRYCNTALRNISIKAEPRTKTDLLDKVFAELQEAILKKRIVKICYYLPAERRDIATDLSPYHLTHTGPAWYVTGKSSFHKGIHTFRLSRIRALHILNKRFVKEKKFDPNEYFSKAWATSPEGRLYNVRLRFLPKVARSVAEVQWHTTQKVTFRKDSSVIIEFQVDGLNEIAGWILSYGDNVQVLAPKTLRKKIIKMARNMLKNIEKPPA